MTALRLTLAYALDLLAGDPEWFPHPVRLFGALIRSGEQALRRISGNSAGQDLLAGAALTGAVTSLAWASGKPKSPIYQVLLAWTTLATRCLLDETRAVIDALESGDLPLARRRIARIVGRDTQDLNESEISRALIETLAESACDGVVAPLFWLAAGGLPFAMAYKAANTLDSMIGHPEPPYRYFGRAAARLDDAANLIPARITALAIAASAKIHGMDARRSLAIWQRDGNRHASPNAGQSEAAIAGALGVQLGGTNYYDGQQHEGPVLFHEGRPASARDARVALTLVGTASFLVFGAAMLALAWRRPK
jgi:adenosylcobinamide-phosphate synthase